MQPYKVPMNKLFTFDMLNYSHGIVYSLWDYITQELQEEVNYLPTENNAEVLDSMYHIGHSDEKYMSPLTVKLLLYGLHANGYTIEELLNDELDTEQLSDVFVDMCDYSYVTSLIIMIYNRFHTKWTKIWDALTTDYEPLENYSMTETRTPNITKTDEFDTTDTRSADLTNTENGTFTKAVDSEASLYGFNSSNKNPANATTGDETNTITDHTNVESGTDTNEKTGTITNTETGTETLTRSGNIGVTTSQQMLESEFEVRKHDFYEMMFNDIDSILCLKSY